ncbi:MAG: histidine kinase dimerization/phospho-acceptor domain-containing protein [Syntrophomonas sp.]
MKNRPLSFQIWMMFVGITMFISILFMALVPFTLRSFFTRQMYNTISESQDMYLSNGHLLEIKDLVKWDQQNQQFRSVKHLILLDNGQLITGLLTVPIQQNLADILTEARRQKSSEQQYSRQIENERIYYIIRKGQLDGNQAYLLSYMWESYQNDLVNTLFSRLMLIIATVLLLSWIPSFWIARYLSKPLIGMEEHVRRIADRDWYKPLEFDRNDEIGRLGKSIERMRERLVRQNEDQQSFLQYISHELKTPVMVIRSYAQAIADGIFPRGGLEGSIKVIDEEAERLEKRIKDLLYLTKLDYLFKLKPEFDIIYVSELVENVVELLLWQRTDLLWDIDTTGNSFRGDYEQWKIALENILDNQIRYAKSRITIKDTFMLINGEPVIQIRIGNDGPPIEPGLLDKLFLEFEKGYQGQFGLGLAIVNQIASHHKAKVWAENEINGVVFYIEVPEGSTIDQS